MYGQVYYIYNIKHFFIDKYTKVSYLHIDYIC